MADLRKSAWHLAKLEDAGIDSARNDLRLLSTVAGERRMDAEELDAWVTRRASREPLQVIIGSTWFRNVEVRCRPGVFIPRPETEIVAGLAIAAAGKAWPDPKVVEACAGTGAITCALVTEVPGVEVIATEIDPVAAELATANVAAALAGLAGCDAADGATARVQVGSLFDPVPAEWRGKVNVLVSNPPYLPASDIGTWAPEVTTNDPVRALVGGEHGNEIVVQLLELAVEWLSPGGTVVLELDPRLAEHATQQARSLGFSEVAIKPDLAGRDRALVAVLPD